MVSKFKYINIIISNSGIKYFRDLKDIKEKDINKVFAVNVKA